jgi:hypothetical protein
MQLMMLQTLESTMQIRKLLLIFSLLSCSNAVAQTDLAGTWQGKLAVSPDQKITIQFIFTKQANGSYSASVNSPDTGGIKNVPASSFSYRDGKLALEVASLSGSYSGILAKGVITGEWRQQGSAFPLALTPYKQPRAATLKPLLGQWVGKLKVTEAMSLTVVFRFENTKEGKFAAFLDSPDQGANGLAVTDVALDGSQVSLKIPISNGEYIGKLENNTITGIYKVGGMELPLNITKGKYEPPPNIVEIPAENMKQLLGRWSGKIGPLTVVLRFERKADGKFVVLFDSPDQKQVGIPVTRAALADGTLSLKIAGGIADYIGKLSGNTIDGTWKQGGKDIPLSLTKE